MAARAVRIEDEQGIPPTPETARKRRDDIIEDLRKRKKLWAEHENAALEIRTVWEAIGRGLFPRAVSLDAAIRPPKGTRYKDFLGRMTDSEMAMWRNNYTPWKAIESNILVTVGRGTRAQMVFDIVVENFQLRQVEMGYGMRHGTAVTELRESLHNYAEIAGWVRR